MPREQTITERCASQYEAGLDEGEIVRATGFSHEQVKAALKRAGCVRGVSDDVARSCVALRAQGKSHDQIAQDVGVSVVCVKWALAYAERHSAAVTPVSDASRAQDHMAEKQMVRRQYAGEANILLLFDLHAPYTHLPALNQALAAKGPFDLVVIGGDAMNMGSWSRFRQDDHYAMMDEMKACMEIEQRIVQKAPAVWKILGNHDERPGKEIGTYLANLMKRLEGEPRKMLLRTAAEIERWYNSPHPEVKVHTHWWLMFGNEARPNIVTHADRYTKARLGTIKAVHEHFLERQMLPQSLCMGHKHVYVPWTPINGCWMSEMPALCRRMGYMDSSKAYGGALHTGYGILRLDRNGNFVPNKSLVHFTEAL